MKLLILLTILFTFVFSTFAGPTTNREEYRGDALLTEKQHEEYTAKLNKGTGYFDSGKYELAEAEFKSILAFAPKKALAYFNLGLTKYKQGEYPQAIDYFDTVIKMRSYYVGAALYYKAIAQMNLDQNDEAAKTAKRYTQARFFFRPSQELIRTIKTGSDEYYENALKAVADGNYELCLLEMDESVLTDTRKGKELVTKCTLALKTEEPVPEPPVRVLKPYYHSLYLDTHVTQTDNIYQEQTNQIKKLTYFVEVGGEYLMRNYVDTGIGFFYNQYNAIDLARFKDETLNVHLPFYFRSNNHRVAAQIFSNLSKYEGDNSYSDVGLGVNYSFTEETKYLLGVYGTTLKRTSLNPAFDYKAGTNNSVRIVASRFINELTLSLIAGYEQNLTGDQPWGPTILPYANKVSSFGFNLSYDFNKGSVLSLRSAYAAKDYTNLLAPNFTDRDDKTTSLALVYQHAFSNNVKAYIQQTLLKNTSNFSVPAELIDRNYNESYTTLGLSVLSY